MTATALNRLETAARECEFEHLLRYRTMLFEHSPAILLLIEEARKLREATRWIPCSEKMPEEGRCVLANVNGQAFVASWIAPTWSALEPSTGFVESCHTEDITHWMPLPPPPSPSCKGTEP